MIFSRTPAELGIDHADHRHVPVLVLDLLFVCSEIPYDTDDRGSGAPAPTGLYILQNTVHTTDAKNPMGCVSDGRPVPHTESLAP